MTDHQNTTHHIPQEVLAKIGILLGRTVGGTLEEDVLTLVKNQGALEDVIADLKKLPLYHAAIMTEKRDALRTEVEQKLSKPSERLTVYWKNFIYNTEYKFADQKALLNVVLSACVFFPLIAECLPPCDHKYDDKIQTEIDTIIPKLTALVKKLRDDSPTVTKEVLIKHAAEIRSLARECEVTEATRSQRGAREQALDYIARIPEGDRLVTFCNMMIGVTMSINNKDVGFVFLISAIPVLASLLPPEETPQTQIH